ncbi:MULTISPECIES: hypothetical protein [Nostocales]|uniref:hypothetical protein n=1 Tax=Nostocales TaxID=1161 RepID=UPI00168314FE|nr:MULTISPECIES: hypothetical protein [Nostocales]MBD2477930.1 hypothetical protein [Anabaena sp. FACHB-83]MBD2487343.1 hypothetical protein [Aulosira sp. FACHB-615]
MPFSVGSTNSTGWSLAKFSFGVMSNDKTFCVYALQAPTNFLNASFSETFNR